MIRLAYDESEFVRKSEWLEYRFNVRMFYFIYKSNRCAKIILCGTSKKFVIFFFSNLRV